MTGNGNGTGVPTAAARARPVVLLRYRPGLTGQSTRTVHLVPLPLAGLAGSAGVALCGALLCPDQAETITPGHGVPCSLCVISHASAGPPPAPASTPGTEPSADGPGGDTRPRPAALGYQTWGWPVILRRNQVWLTLEPHTVALIIPALLAAQVTAILSQPHYPPPVLVHPDAPEHRVLLAGEPYGVDLPWPPGVHRASGALPLPPTKTPRGPVTWVHPPQPDALRMCREVDVFAALRTVLRNAPPAEPPPGSEPP